MNEDYSEDDLDFSQMSHEELSEIVNSGLGCYRQRVIDGAKNELQRRTHEGAPVESSRQVTNGEVQPSTSPEEVRLPVLPEDVPESRLYSAGQIALATALGTPVAGCLLLARNYEVLEKGRAAWQSLVAGIASTILLIALGFVLPENFPGRGGAIGVCIAMHQIAKHSQGAAIEMHLKAGGRKGSWPVTILIAAVSSLIVFGLLFAVAIAFNLE
jgi:hypothetical protein